MTTILPIVGARYRPPQFGNTSLAMKIIEVLAVGTPLILRPEPTNPADSNAKMVLVKTVDITNEAFAALDDGRLRPFGTTISDLAKRDEWVLGYIPAIAASHPNMAAIHSDLEGKFRLSPNHSVPQIELGS
jgi:hypothetical protein